MATPNINSPSTDSTASLSDTPTFELSDNSAGRSPSINQTFSFGATTSDPLRSVQRCEVDINSCLQLLLDVYGNTILTSATAPIAVLNEAIRSVKIDYFYFLDFTFRCIFFCWEIVSEVIIQSSVNKVIDSGELIRDVDGSKFKN